MTYEEAIEETAGGARVRRPSFGLAYVSRATSAFGGAFTAKTVPPMGNARRYVPTNEDLAATDWVVVS